MAFANDREERLRRLRHELRDAFNLLRMCVEVLRIPMDPAEVIEWLD